MFSFLSFARSHDYAVQRKLVYDDIEAWGDLPILMTGGVVIQRVRDTDRYAKVVKEREEAENKAKNIKTRQKARALCGKGRQARRAKHEHETPDVDPTPPPRAGPSRLRGRPDERDASPTASSRERVASPVPSRRASPVPSHRASPVPSRRASVSPTSPSRSIRATPSLPPRVTMSPPPMAASSSTHPHAPPRFSPSVTPAQTTASRPPAATPVFSEPSLPPLSPAITHPALDNEGTSALSLEEQERQLDAEIAELMAQQTQQRINEKKAMLMRMKGKDRSG